MESGVLTTAAVELLRPLAPGSRHAGAMSTRLRVRLHPDTLTPPVLISVKRDTVLGLSEIRARVDAGEPVLDVGMFTNGWYDAAAHSLLMTLAEWDDSGVGWSAVEIGDGGPDRDDVPVTLDYPA